MFGKDAIRCQNLFGKQIEDAHSNQNFSGKTFQVAVLFSVDTILPKLLGEFGAGLWQNYHLPKCVDGRQRESGSFDQRGKFIQLVLRHPTSSYQNMHPVVHCVLNWANFGPNGGMP